MRRALVPALAAGALLSESPALADPPVGTFSIVAYDSLTGEVGVAVQSRVFSVGPPVAWARAGVGAVATQAQTNESFGPRGLDLMEDGLSARQALDSLLAGDGDRELRQVGIVDAAGRTAAWTGGKCSSWAGDAQGAGFSCQGNILVSGKVVAGMAEAFMKSAGEELGLRMILALEAGQAAGGDRRGRQSAAIVIGREHPDHPEYATRYVDLHVEDHKTPIAELKRLYDIHEAQNLAQAHLRFADLRESRGDLEGARWERGRVGKILQRTLEREGVDAGTYNALAWYCAIHDIHLEDALEAARRAVALSPEDSNILDTLAELYFRLGNKEKAVETAGRALALSPEDAYLKGQLARFRGEGEAR